MRMVLCYGAEAWTLKIRDGRKITSMEMWLWYGMKNKSWMEKKELTIAFYKNLIKRELLGHVRKRKLSYFGHLCIDHGCQITKTVVEGYAEGRQRRGRPVAGRNSSPMIKHDLPKRKRWM